MKSIKYSLIIACLIFCFAIPVLAFPEDNPSNLLRGMVLLDLDNKGEAWYVYPGDFHRYRLDSPADAYNIMSNLSLGISNDNFARINTSAPNKFEGLILLKPEDFGKAYYVNPLDDTLVYLPDAASAFDLLIQSAIIATSEDLQSIPTGKIILDDTGREIYREWQYHGWWGEVNKNYVPALKESKSDSLKLGFLSAGNRVKVLGVKKVGGRAWYQIDGGRYPGAYVDSLFVNAIAQPVPEKKLAIPVTVKAGDYWVDVNISKKILTLYKYDQVIMATYIAVGVKETPTIFGVYNVWFKIDKIRMRGAPPLATHVYDLADVPWVMFYKGSYSIHGTYWHDDFGEQKSSGCTNITQGDAKFIFDITGPKMGNLSSIRPTPDNPGMVINNHY